MCAKLEKYKISQLALAITVIRISIRKNEVKLLKIEIISNMSISIYRLTLVIKSQGIYFI